MEIVLYIFLAVVAVLTSVLFLLEFLFDMKDVTRTFRTLKAVKKTDVREWDVQIVTLVNGAGVEKKIINQIEVGFGEHSFLIKKTNGNKDVRILDKGGWVQKGETLEYQLVSPCTLLAMLTRKRIRKNIDKKGKILLDIHSL